MWSAFGVTSFVVGMAFLSLTCAVADQPVLGTITPAKVAPDALLIWDASPAVAAFSTVSKTPADEAMKSLESQAMNIAAERAPQLTSAARIMVRMIYLKLGSVSPIYHSATFAGVERVFTMSVSRDNVMKNGPEWITMLASGTVPEGVSLTITGKLPPVQQ